ncbi:MAG: MMPL family transporter, partial [Angustibacter sp.]
MERINAFVARRSRWIFGFWLLIFVAGMGAAPALQDRLSFDFSLPGQEGYETEAKLLKSYGTLAFPSYIPTLTAPTGEDIPANRADVAAVADALREVEGLRVLDYASTSDDKFLTSDKRTTFVLVFSPPVAGFVDPAAEEINKIVADAAKERGLTSGMTGYQQLAAGSAESEGPSVFIETLIGGLGALVVLLFVFASLLALVPIIIAAVSILATFLIVLGLTTFTDVSFVVNFLISLVGLGVAIDYSLLVVSRWREERALGASNDEAVTIAVRTAGHAVLASGVTVAISLIALILVPVPLLRSMGIGGMLIPVMSVSVVLTLLPAMLRKFGPKMDWPRIRHEEKASTGWSTWARMVVRFRWLAAGLAIAGLAVAIAPFASLQIGQANSASLASNGPAVDALKTLKDGGVGTGVLSNITILTDGNLPKAIAEAAREVPGVRTAVVLPPGLDGKVAVEVIPNEETVDSRSVETVTAIRDAVKDKPGYIGVTGIGATVLDYISAVYKTFPLVLALIAFVTYIL